MVDHRKNQFFGSPWKPRRCRAGPCSSTGPRPESSCPVGGRRGACVLSPVPPGTSGPGAPISVASPAPRPSWPCPWSQPIVVFLVSILLLLLGLAKDDELQKSHRLSPLTTDDPGAQV